MKSDSKCPLNETLYSSQPLLLIVRKLHIKWLYLTFIDEALSFCTNLVPRSSQHICRWRASVPGMCHRSQSGRWLLGMTGTSRADTGCPDTRRSHPSHTRTASRRRRCRNRTWRSSWPCSHWGRHSPSLWSNTQVNNNSGPINILIECLK